MKKIISNIATKDKGRKLKVFATIFAAIFALIALATGLALKNYEGRRTDLTQTTAAATAPTDTSKYWTDEAAWSAAGKDFNNYTLSGSGSPGDPYLIQNEWDLAYLSWTIYAYNTIGTGQVIISGSFKYFYSGIYFKQTANLDLSAYYWQPIGVRQLRDDTSARRYFSGRYNGDGHIVAGIFTPAGKSGGYSYQGLFGDVYGYSSTDRATISNVGVIDSFVQGHHIVGGVVGYVGGNSTVTNCYNTGSVSGGENVGGVVGYMEYSYGSVAVTNCYNTGSVKGSTPVGGIVGYAGSNSTIKNCYNTGLVSGSATIGGVVGSASSNSTIKNCYNTGSVEGGNYSNYGGVVGYAGSSTVTNCYNTGSVSGGESVGGVAGNTFTCAISKTYYGGNCTLNVGIASGAVSGSAVKIDKPVEEWAKNKEWYSADAVNPNGTSVWNNSSPWVFESAWEFVSIDAPSYVTNNGYPVLQGVGGNSQVVYWTDEAVWSAAGKDFNNYTLSGSGSQADPYLIQNEWDLAYLSWTIYTTNPIQASHVSGSRYYSDVYFEQTADLDLSAYYWQPIGIQYLRDGTSATRSFSGSYDGGSHTVSEVFTPAGSSNGYSYQGLFGRVSGQSSTSKATISNVGMIDSFVQGYSYVGGVVGDAAAVTVENCYNTGSVYASTNYVGGVVGGAQIEDILNCYNTGSVSGSSSVGGVVGDAHNYSIIENCYNTGSVSGSGENVGGVVGKANINSTVSNCYNTGSVSGSGSRVGGVVGSAYSITITNCYNTGSVSGSDFVGGVVGNASSDTVENCYNTGSVSGSGEIVGGVAGGAYINSTITNCYNTGSVEGSYVGGVVGGAWDSSTVTNCYNAGSVSGSGARVGGVVGRADNSTVTNCGFEGVINGSSSVGAIVGWISNSSATISNCYAVAESDSEISLVGSNSGNGTIENIVGVVICGGQVSRMYRGDDFTAFAWLNFDSSPVLEHFTWAGQFQEPPADYAGNSNWILTKMQSEGWTEILV